MSISEPIMRTCTKCKQVFPATQEYFSKHKGCKYGLNSVCKPCSQKAALDYHYANHDKVLAKKRAYNKENKDMLYITKKKWAEENRDKVRANHRRWKANHPNANREYYEANKEQALNKQKERRKAEPDKFHDCQKAAYIKNKDHYLEYQKEYRKNNREKCNQYSIKKNHKRRAMARDLLHTFTHQEWRECKKYFGHSCAYCGKPAKKLSQDHVVPLTKMGEYTRGNIVPACKSCNSSKADTEMVTWFSTQSFFSEARLRKILRWTGLKKGSNTQQIAMF